MAEYQPWTAFFALLGMMLLAVAGPLDIPSTLGLPMLAIGLAGVVAASMAGLSEPSLLGYTHMSYLAQFSYFLLDIGAALHTGKTLMYAALHALNFAIAGGLFTLVLYTAYKNMDEMTITKYSGMYQHNQWLFTAFIISCLSLGGLPGLNIFVTEFLIYSVLYTVNPLLTALAMLATLACFLMHFRMIHIVMAPGEGKMLRVGAMTKTILMALAALVIILGVVPKILLMILGMMI